MAVPKQHRSKSRQGQRRMHYFIKEQSFVLCGHCGKDTLSHRVCPSCGYYKGHEVVNTAALAKKKTAKSKTS
ncbi:MAG: 50S ribosomal protein L32 [bacterium]|nr:50S ribosomal protein L32 [bacterium]